METTATFRTDAKIKWHRPHVDEEVMAELLQRSDFQGYRQALGHLALCITTGTLAYLAFLNVSSATWIWSVPLLLAALFAHGTVGAFLGGTACHELGHRTVFKSKAPNEIFLRIFSFFGWWDHVWFRPSHIKHHQLTTHHDFDGEVVLPQRFTFKDWQFWLGLFGWNPVATWKTLVTYFKRATGRLDNEWYEFLMPENNKQLRHRHRDWARFCLIGHAVLATVFILTGHWFLIFLFNIGSHYCGWLQFLCGTPQHYGMQGDVADHRLCCRTYISTGLPAFLYWNMQYHVEHHMFPAVPFFNVPKLRQAIESDLPPAPRGLWATWKGMLEIHRKQREEPDYFFVPELPAGLDDDQASDQVLEREASGANV